MPPKIKQKLKPVGIRTLPTTPTSPTELTRGAIAAIKTALNTIPITAQIPEIERLTPRQLTLSVRTSPIVFAIHPSPVTILAAAQTNLNNFSAVKALSDINTTIIRRLSLDNIVHKMSRQLSPAETTTFPQQLSVDDFNFGALFRACEQAMETASAGVESEPSTEELVAYSETLTQFQSDFLKIIAKCNRSKLQKTNPCDLSDHIKDAQDMITNIKTLKQTILALLDNALEQHTAMARYAKYTSLASTTTSTAYTKPTESAVASFDPRPKGVILQAGLPNGLKPNLNLILPPGQDIIAVLLDFQSKTHTCPEPHKAAIFYRLLDNTDLRNEFIAKCSLSGETDNLGQILHIPFGDPNNPKPNTICQWAITKWSQNRATPFRKYVMLRDIKYWFTLGGETHLSDPQGFNAHVHQLLNAAGITKNNVFDSPDTESYFAIQYQHWLPVRFDKPIRAIIEHWTDNLIQNNQPIPEQVTLKQMMTWANTAFQRFPLSSRAEIESALEELKTKAAKQTPKTTHTTGNSSNQRADLRINKTTDGTNADGVRSVTYTHTDETPEDKAKRLSKNERLWKDLGDSACPDCKTINGITPHPVTYKDGSLGCFKNPKHPNYKPPRTQPNQTDTSAANHSNSGSNNLKRPYSDYARNK